MGLVHSSKEQPEVVTSEQEIKMPVVVAVESKPVKRTHKPSSPTTTSILKAPQVEETTANTNETGDQTSEFEFPHDNDSATSSTAHADKSSSEYPEEMSVDMTLVNVAAQEDKAHLVVSVDNAQFGNSAPPPPTVPRDVKNNLSIAEQGRQAALAKYQDKGLVLDHKETLLAEEVLGPAMTTFKDWPQIVPKH